MFHVFLYRISRISFHNLNDRFDLVDVWVSRKNFLGNCQILIVKLKSVLLNTKYDELINILIA